MNTALNRFRTAVIAAGLAAALSGLFAQAPRQAAKPAPKGPWMDETLSPDRRAELVIEQMTLEEKIGLAHGAGMMGFGGAPVGR